MTRVRTNDDQNDKDDNIDCDQTGGRCWSLRCRVLRRRHGESISGYDWLSVRYPGWLMTAAAITDHDNKEHTILSTLHMSQHLLYVIINYLWTGLQRTIQSLKQMKNTKPIQGKTKYLKSFTLLHFISRFFQLCFKKNLPKLIALFLLGLFLCDAWCLVIYDECWPVYSGIDVSLSLRVLCL